MKVLEQVEKVYRRGAQERKFEAYLIYDEDFRTQSDKVCKISMLAIGARRRFSSLY